MKYLVLTIIPWEGLDENWFDTYKEAKKYCQANNLYAHMILKAKQIEFIDKAQF